MGLTEPASRGFNSGPEWVMGGTMRESTERGELRALAGDLEGAHAPEIRRAVREILRQFGDNGSLLGEIQELASAEEPEARHIACGLLTRCFTENRTKTAKLLEQLAADKDWTVREAAGQAAGSLLRTSFKDVLEILRRFAGHESAHVRRCVPMAAMKAARTRRLEYAEPLLKLLAPLLDDRDPIVRRSLGPFALGGGLLRAYPDAAFEYLVQWSTSYDAQVLWNIAMAFSGAGAAEMPRKAIIVLRKLSLDERRYVWRAVASAMWKLGRREEDVVRDELARWLEDPDRHHVARAALQHL
ncbi:MAG: HEAT repeat domain-containing protein [Candidatus Bipolaricaulota bacterium]|nr:MAG: HEAT repeat domain-containing protein [Candidatus Bipolaricaulota bacterium]